MEVTKQIYHILNKRPTSLITENKQWRKTIKSWRIIALLNENLWQDWVQPFFMFSYSILQQ